MELKLIHPDATEKLAMENIKSMIVVVNGKLQISFQADGTNQNENLSAEELSKFGNYQIFESEIFSRIDNAVEAEKSDERKTMLTVLKGFIEEHLKNSSM